MTTTETCQHHWHIDPPDGPTSWGECQVCGIAKEFANATPYGQAWFAHKEASDNEKEERSAVLEARKQHDQGNLGYPYQSGA